MPRPSLAADAAYQVIAAHDARFDGRLFVGVTSTGIYCRPVCRVRTPKQANCRFFETPAQAEAASFRPCLKCRPELAPGTRDAWTVMDASRTLAMQAADALDAQLAGDDGPPSVGRLAARLGVSDRHLRRIFQSEHGVAPLQYLQTRRLLLAKQLLTDTRLSVAEVAFASGFNSLRRFNAAFSGSYRMNPSRLRGATPAGGSAETLAGRGVEVQLAYRMPYDVDTLLRFIAARAVPEVEAVAGRCIRRSVRAGTLAPAAGWIEVEFDSLLPILRLRYAAALAPASGRVVVAVRRWLDLDATPLAIDAVLTAGADALPGAPGLRLPGGIDGHELAVRAVLGQQVTVAAARTAARRLVERFGVPVETPWPQVSHSFPSPEVLGAAPTGEIAALGIIRSRAAAIVALARAWPGIAPLLARSAPAEPLIAALCALPGIGPWTAHYVAMRALGWPDAFPPNDVAVLKAMNRLYATTTRRDAERRARAWQPWRSYAVLRLWESLGRRNEVACATLETQP